MKILDNEELYLLSFPDIKVTSMSIDMKNKQAYIETNRCWIASLDRLFYHCKMTITDWSNICVQRYYVKTEELKTLSEDQFENLRDICDFEFGENLIFEGFGKDTGLWLIYTFFNAKISASVMENP